MKNHFANTNLALLLALVAAFAANGCDAKSPRSDAPGDSGSLGGGLTVGRQAGDASLGGERSFGGAGTGGDAGTDGSSLYGDAGAGGLNGEAGAPSEPCFGPAGTVCRPAGFPFVVATFPYAENCLAPDCPQLAAREQDGALCLSGPAPAAGAHVHFPLLYLTDLPFDAAALGITQFSFTVESPPLAGVHVEAGFLFLEPETCAGRDIRECIQFGFDLPPITEAGTTRAAFSDLVQRDSHNRYQTFDAHRLASINFGVNEGPYSFCVRDFKFLDSNGDEVLPPPPAQP